MLHDVTSQNGTVNKHYTLLVTTNTAVEQRRITRLNQRLIQHSCQNYNNYVFPTSNTTHVFVELQVGNALTSQKLPVLGVTQYK